MGISQRNKGKAGERELAHKLNELLGTSCRRGQQYCGVEGDDVVGLNGFHVECKRVERIRLSDAMNQASSDAKQDETPIIFHRSNKQPWLVTIKLDDLPLLASKVQLILNEKEKVIEEIVSDCN